MKTSGHVVGQWMRILLLSGIFFWVLPSLSASWAETDQPQTGEIRNARLDVLLDELVTQGAVPGISLLITEHGQESYFGISGYLDKEAKIALRRDAVGRYYSMTKPIVGVALMTLFEQEKFALDDPIAKYLPEFSNLQVYTGHHEDDAMQLADPVRPVTIRDLMRHTSGMTYGFFSNTPVDKLYRDAGLLSYEDTNAQFTQKLAQIPLDTQPGIAWKYSVSVDVQGRLIEVLSGQTLGDFLRKTIFEPLGMNHTGFAVKPSDHPVFGPAYQLDKTGLQRLGDHGEAKTALLVDDPFLHKKPFESGGGGLVSTIDDYARFANMLAANGILDEARILQAETLTMMTRNQLGEIDHGELGANVGFGLDFAVQIHPNETDLQLPVGTYSWGGMAGTYFWVDPKNDLTAVMQIQVIGASQAKVRKRVVAATYRPTTP